MTNHAKIRALPVLSGISLAVALAAVTCGAVAQTTAPLAATVVNAQAIGICNLPHDLTAAANGGDPQAQAKLAAYYLTFGYASEKFNQAARTPASPGENAQAIDCFKKAAALGNGEADQALGFIYTNDEAQAFKYFHAGALLMDPVSEYFAGLMYTRGWGVPEDFPRGAVWIYQAAEEGESDAKRDLVRFPGLMEFGVGLAYADGDGAAQDYAQANQWYRKAAEKGNPRAAHNLGIDYWKGLGVDANAPAAADWLYKAGVAFLHEHDPDDALLEAQAIRNIQAVDPTLPNGFLAKQLTDQIYARVSQSGSALSSVAQPTLKEGTGWPVAGGFIVTNHHVISGADAIWVRIADGSKLEASIAADDPNNDLVLLKVQNPRGLPPALPLASSPAQIGESVFAVGYPEPDIMGGNIKLTSGVISAAAGAHDDPRYYQTSTEIQDGSSGSPLLDMKGDVVGILSASLDAVYLLKHTGDLPENVNYAIKVVYLKALLQSVQPAADIRQLPVQSASLENLEKRIAPSVIRVFARVPASTQH